MQDLECRLFPMPDVPGISFGAAQFLGEAGRREASRFVRKGRRAGAQQVTMR